MRRGHGRRKKSSKSSRNQSINHITKSNNHTLISIILKNNNNHVFISIDASNAIHIVQQANYLSPALHLQLSIFSFMWLPVLRYASKLLDSFLDWLVNFAELESILWLDRCLIAWSRTRENWRELAIHLYWARKSKSDMRHLLEAPKELLVIIHQPKVGGIRLGFELPYLLFSI